MQPASVVGTSVEAVWPWVYPYQFRVPFSECISKSRMRGAHHLTTFLIGGQHFAITLQVLESISWCATLRSRYTTGLTCLAQSPGSPKSSIMFHPVVNTLQLVLSVWHGYAHIRQNHHAQAWLHDLRHYAFHRFRTRHSGSFFAKIAVPE